MFDKLYITVETNFYGPTYGFVCERPDTWGQMEDIFCECSAVAADEYSTFAENQDVPYDVLWESVKITGVSSFRPSETYIEWLKGE